MPVPVIESHYTSLAPLVAEEQQCGLVEYKLGDMTAVPGEMEVLSRCWREPPQML